MLFYICIKDLRSNNFMKKSPYIIPKGNAFSIISVMCMIVCTALRIFYYSVKGVNAFEFFTLLLLPLLSAVIFIAVVLLPSPRIALVTPITGHFSSS